MSLLASFQTEFLVLITISEETWTHHQVVEVSKPQSTEGRHITLFYPGDSVHFLFLHCESIPCTLKGCRWQFKEVGFTLCFYISPGLEPTSHIQIDTPACMTPPVLSHTRTHTREKARERFKCDLHHCTLQIVSCEKLEPLSQVDYISPALAVNLSTVYQQGWLVNTQSCHSPPHDSPLVPNLQINFLLEAQSMASRRGVVWLCGDTPGVHSSHLSPHSSRLPPPLHPLPHSPSSQVTSLRWGSDKVFHVNQACLIEIKLHAPSAPFCLRVSHLCFLFLNNSLGGCVFWRCWHHCFGIWRVLPSG